MDRRIWTENALKSGGLKAVVKRWLQSLLCRLFGYCCTSCIAFWLAEWWNGRVVEWPSGRLAEWSTGRVVDWLSGRLVEWSTGRVQFGALCILISHLLRLQRAGLVSSFTWVTDAGKASKVTIYHCVCLSHVCCTILYLFTLFYISLSFTGSLGSSKQNNYKLQHDSPFKYQCH